MIKCNMKLLKLTILIIILISCKSETSNKRNIDSQIEFNLVVDNILRYRLDRVSVVQIETMPIFRTIPIDSSYKYSHDQPPPPPPDILDYSKTFFNAMIKRNLLDSIDADFMYSTIDSSLVVNVDSNLISKPTLSKSYLDCLFKKDIDYAYDYLNENYGTSCFIKLGTPVFNQSKTRLILAIDYYCGPLNGQGSILILKKENKKWMIIEELGTWES